MERQRQHLKQGLQPLKQALEAHRRSLEELERALIEVERNLGGQQERPEHPQAKQQGGESLDLLSITEVCQELGMGKSWSTDAYRVGRYPA